MEGWGDPISYVTLQPGTPVLTADHASIGEVEHVLFVPEEDVFEGVVVKTEAGIRFVDRDQIDAIYEHAVVTSLTAEQAAALPEPEPGTPVYRDDPALGAGHSLRDFYLRIFRKGGWMKEDSGEQQER